MHQLFVITLTLIINLIVITCRTNPVLGGDGLAYGGALHAEVPAEGGDDGGDAGLGPVAAPHKVGALHEQAAGSALHAFHPALTSE